MLGDLTAVTLTIFGAVIFFFASAGASAAYLTASEVFPMETRALCIAFFYAIGTAVGGITGPLLFGKLIDNASASKDITGIAAGYFLGAALMIAGGIVEAFLGVKAEGQSLENIAKPLTAEDAETRPRPTSAPPAAGLTAPPTPGGAPPCRCHRPRPAPRVAATARSSTRWARSSGPSRPAAASAPSELAALVGATYWEARPLRPGARPRGHRRPGLPHGRRHAAPGLGHPVWGPVQSRQPKIR